MSEQNENTVVAETETPVRFARIKKVLKKLDENSPIIAVATAAVVMVGGTIVLNRIIMNSVVEEEVIEATVIDVTPTED